MSKKYVRYNSLNSGNSIGTLFSSLGYETDRFMLAKSYFDCREYYRCAFHLKDCKSPKAVFLKLYAKYIAGEKKKEEDSEGILKPKDGITSNTELITIIKELDDYFTKYDTEDPFLLYMYGIIMSKKKNEKLAISKLIKSVSLYPYNWSVWMELLSCIKSYELLCEIIPKLPKHIMTKFFILTANQEFFQPMQNLQGLIQELDRIFPDLPFLVVQKALINYHNLNYTESEATFDQVIKKDPHRLDDMDTYSNILYVMEMKSKLAFLAQLSSATDKFRPETCCIVANYYSLKSEHEKAIMYYRRALTLNRDCLSAWTLMGHEFVELKNSHAAIESYRRAIDANNKDFRAWYGLGQAYEVLDMHYYSLYYYQRAAALKSMDPRMWQALGNCYDKLERFDDAIKAYKRALQVSEMDPLILFRLGILNEKIQDMKSAAFYMKTCLQEEQNEGVTDETSKARLWLARYELNLSNWEQAQMYASNLIHGTPHEIEEARAIVRDTRSRIESERRDSFINR
ncbi:subunit of the anaphase-promoting complex/cyclosome [Nadsonia fulvescens var. elongata DSM 6958]|uniref:Subunit of the anaphase-promoting complex/cyclosome n=1 Tax=Nadsonia fulvescens var. elongata DSM 6958 TaxID=857566 RepID=A0A1E3PKZ0_9ASCO|nr:subunit of the anaphase-promoting complex/cyclosome [Nadsonia fulvescens var. elongata DSM 6958]